jgi:long-chain acyl-CoA synthetase
MDHFWLKSYPAGVPAEINPDQYPSLVALLDEAFARFGQRQAYRCMDRIMTFAELDRDSNAFAAWLQSLGLGKGKRVAIMLPNVLQFPVAMAGVLRAGCTVVNVNPLYTPRELEHQLTDSGAEAIVVLENFAHTLEQVIVRTQVRHVVVATLGDRLGLVKGALVNLVVRHVKKLVPRFELPSALGFNEVLRLGAGRALQPVQVGHQDIAFLQYTGGTTGLSKGAMLTHRNLIANLLQVEAWLQPALNDPRKGPLPEQMTFVCALPLYHIFALSVCALMGARVGAMNLLIPNPRDLPNLIAELGKVRPTIFPAVNTLYNALANHPDFAKLDHSSLRISNGGGMAVQRAVAQRWLEITGCPICEGYGLSETSPVATSNPSNTDAYSGTIGLPLPSTEIRILDEEGHSVPQGERGEIGIRGPQVMAGYWNRPEETAHVMTADGFFRSGDIGQMDERGYVRIVDRKKDMILVSGFNVYPNEVEDVLAGHPGVLECAAVGVPDGASGEAVKVFVVKRDAALTEEDVIAWCAQSLTGYKRPKHVEFRADLPKTNVGKILRRELRSV